MMTREYEVEAFDGPVIYPCPVSYEGYDPKGRKAGFTNYYMEYDGKPYFAASGEMHFSRIEEQFWEDEIIKMKMGGLTMISTYLFWIHHEEEKGKFDWSGNKNLRRFITLCGKHKIFVLLRVGPFSHGECRNGGLPDWMFGAPYDVRSNDPEYLFYVKRYFKEIGREVRGLLFQDGGPIIGVQLENEYEHASSPWEMTTENSGEWTPSGNDGPSHLKRLKKIALEAGLKAPLYSTTAWGGACAPVETVMPLWGGYAYRPWIFYGDDIKEHPPTAEFIYQDFHNNEKTAYYNFDPEYSPEDFPFICCEMGGGMANYYRYRFQLPYESVDALANVKVAGGCNFPGYYMFHGGTNPPGKSMPYLNESGLPKMSYDYQAAIGEYGQIRNSYKRLKLLHYFCKCFEKQLCYTKTYLPAGADSLNPADVDTLRYCVRASKDSGFLFLNNFQDHVEMKPKDHISVTVKWKEEEVRIPETGSFSLEKAVSCILPVRMEMDGLLLRYATAQLIYRMMWGDKPVYFFFAPEGINPEFYFEGIGPVHMDGSNTSSFRMNNPAGQEVVICVLSREDSLKFWVVEREGNAVALLSEETVLDDCKTIRMESIGKEKGIVSVFPGREFIRAGGTEQPSIGENDIFSVHEITYGKNLTDILWEDVSSKEKEGAGALKRPVVGSPITSTKLTNARASIRVTEETFKCCKQALISVDYEGDIGYAFTDGNLINDNFSNGACWEFGLKAHQESILKNGIYIYVSPRKKGSRVSSESAMAARFEIYEEAVAKINGIKILPVFDCETDI